MNRLLPAPQSGIDETKESKIDGQTECHFDMNECSFLDHTVGYGQIHPMMLRLQQCINLNSDTEREMYKHSSDLQYIIENLFFTMLKLEFHSQKQ